MTTKINGIELNENEVKALGMLSRAEATPEGAVYYDDATQHYWLSDWDDVARLPEAESYSHWCAETVSADLGGDYAELSEEEQEANRLGE